MIAHLAGREKALEPFGWTGRQAEWIALVCLHKQRHRAGPAGYIGSVYIQLLLEDRKGGTDATPNRLGYATRGMLGRFV